MAEKRSPLRLTKAMREGVGTVKNTYHEVGSSLICFWGAMLCCNEHQFCFIYRFSFHKNIGFQRVRATLRYIVGLDIRRILALCYTEGGWGAGAIEVILVYLFRVSRHLFYKKKVFTIGVAD